ncbi:MAG: right-handed parallel beta-helix repeat-containing protein [Acidimicrobiia bacterium]
MTKRVAAMLGALVLLAATLALPVDGAAAAPAADAKVIRVPQDEATIQDAVDAATPGTLVLVSPGVYKEAVTVVPRHKNIVIRGVDRATTILDGEFSGEKGAENGFLVFADGVAIENMTARNFSKNGFFWTGVDGYRGSYLTAIRNGDYGIYAFDSVNGQFDNSYASGSPDAGFYIGQCFPCNALIVDSEAEWNGLGYSGTNAGGDLLIARSSWHDNRAGIVPNSLTSEELSPQREATVIGNHVYDNNNTQTPAIEIAEIALGNGILLAGGRKNLAERNLVTGHDIAGIAVIPLPETVLSPDDPDARDFDGLDNTVRDNVTTGNQFDLVSVTNITDASDGGGNCFAGNDFTTSTPIDIQIVLPCGEPAVGYSADIALFASLLGGEKPPSADYTTVTLPDPPALATMSKAKTAKARPATHEPSIRVKVKALEIPTGA